MTLQTTKSLLNTLPSPIALNWGLLLHSTTDLEQLNYGWCVVDSFSQYLCAIVVSAYLRNEEKIEVVEGILEAFEPTSNKHIQALLNNILSTVQDDHFLDAIRDWYYTDNIPSELANVYNGLLQMRHNHAVVVSESEASTLLPEVIQSLEHLLLNTTWLTAYQLFKVDNPEPNRSGGFKGNVLFYMGDVKNPIPLKEQSWEATLFEDIMYLSHPSGTKLMEMHPFIHMRNLHIQDSILMWTGIVEDAVQVECNVESERILIAPTLRGVEVTWSQFLIDRDKITGYIQHSKPDIFGQVNNLGENEETNAPLDVQTLNVDTPEEITTPSTSDDDVSQEMDDIKEDKETKISIKRVLVVIGLMLTTVEIGLMGIQIIQTKSMTPPSSHNPSEITSPKLPSTAPIPTKDTSQDNQQINAIKRSIVNGITAMQKNVQALKTKCSDESNEDLFNISDMILKYAEKLKRTNATDLSTLKMFDDELNDFNGTLEQTVSDCNTERINHKHWFKRLRK